MLNVKVSTATSMRLATGVAVAWVLAIGGVLALPQRTYAADLQGPQTLVKIPSGASLEQVLQAFKDATGLPCIAEKPTSERHTGATFTGPFNRAVSFVSETLDYHVQARSGALLFYCQYSLPTDHPALPVNELEPLSSDLYRLVHAFKQPPVTGDMNGDQEALIASFNAAQIQQLQGHGLPVTALPPAQARLWLAVNSAFVYNASDQRLGELADCLKHWNRCEVFSYQGPPDDDKRLGVRYLQTGVPGGYRQYILPGASGGPTRVALHRLGATVLPSRPNRLPSRFDQTVELSAGPSTLASLFERVRTGTGFDVQLPSHASQYGFVTSGGSLKARDLVDGLTEMVGQRCVPDAKGRYTLAHPRYGAARTAAELRQAVEALVPPSLTLLCTQNFGSAMLWERGQMDQVKAACQPEALLAGVKVTDLPADLQERVAQALTLETVAPLFLGRSLLGALPPPGFMLTPEQCTLHVGSGAMPGAKLPSGFIPAGQVFRVTVPRPTGGTDEWGWVIGSATVTR